MSATVLADFDPLSESGLRDPFPVWAEARRRAPVFYAPAVGMWMVTRREHVLEALRDRETFSSAHNMDSPPPPERVRELLPGGYPWTAPSLANGDGGGPPPPPGPPPGGAGPRGRRGPWA